MVFQKLQVSKDFSRISQVSQSRFSNGSVCLAVSFFRKGISKSQFGLAI